MSRSIPVKNIFYMLAYAWDHRDIVGDADLAATPFADLADLLAHVLEIATSRQLKRGFDRKYVACEEEVLGIKGRLLLGQTITRHLLAQGRTRSRFSFLSHNVPHNQILKTTLQKLASTHGVTSDVRTRIRWVLHRMPEVDSIFLSEDVFRRVRIPSNHRMYKLLIDICRLLYYRLLPQDEDGRYRFQEFSKKRMNLLFERFIRKFYGREQGSFVVKSQSLSWVNVEASEDELKHWPGMITDVSLCSPTRNIVIDAKYYAEALKKSPYGGEDKVSAPNVYQMFAYLFNMRAKGLVGVEGILLYPEVDKPIRLTYRVHGFQIRIQTVDLNQPWADIHQSLLDLIR